MVKDPIVDEVQGIIKKEVQLKIKVVNLRIHEQIVTTYDFWVAGNVVEVSKIIVAIKAAAVAVDEIKTVLAEPGIA